MEEASTDRSDYERIVEHIFFSHFAGEEDEFVFERREIAEAAKELSLDRPKNLGDVIYSYRYRRELPRSILETAPEGSTWVIRPAGRARYQFALTALEAARIVPRDRLVETKVPNSTPGLISKYALSDEQALLAVLRYNRLIDVFTGVTCYSLQNHLRTSVKGVGQIETDELYIGMDRSGVHYVLPVQAKGGSDALHMIQIEQDLAMCAEKFPNLLCRPIAAQFIQADLIALFEFQATEGGAAIIREKHYRLVSSEDISDDDLRQYRERLAGASSE